VSPDDCLTHADFRDKHGVTICAALRSEGEVCRKYGVAAGKGERRRRAARMPDPLHFVIDKKGVIRHAAYDVKPAATPPRSTAW